jgi:hypothetical protein
MMSLCCLDFGREPCMQLPACEPDSKLGHSTVEPDHKIDI